MAKARKQQVAFLSVASILLIIFSLSIGSAGNVFAQAQFGTGWTGEFFGNATLTDPVIFTQQFPTGININWGGDSPAPGIVPEDNWSARFTSVQLFNQGTYEFVVASDDGVRVFIDNNLVLDRFIGRVLTTDRFQLSLTAGTHAIRLEYFDGIDQAALQFQWFQISVGFGTGTPIFGGGVLLTPTAVPTRTVTPLPPIPPGAQTATVIRASVLLSRAAPYFAAPVVGRILRGQTYQVIGRDPDARWFLLQLSNGVQGWSWWYYLFVSGNEFSAPVVGGFVTAGQPANSTGVIAQTNATMRLRGAPSVLAPQTGRIPWGDLLPIIGKTRDGGWYQVVFRGTVGWVASGFVTILEGNLSNVPVTG
jgi:hypothetical protein